MAVLGNLGIISLIAVFVPLWFPGIIMHNLTGEMPGIIIGNLSYIPDEEADNLPIDDDRDLIVRVKDHTAPINNTDIELTDSRNRENDTIVVVYDFSNETHTNATTLISEPIRAVDNTGATSYTKTSLPNLQNPDAQTSPVMSENNIIMNDYFEKQDDISHDRFKTITVPITTASSSTDNVSTNIVTTSGINIANSKNEYLSTNISKMGTTVNGTKNRNIHKVRNTSYGTGYHVHSDQHKTPNSHHPMPFRHHHLQLVPMEDEPFGAVILKDQRYVVSVMIPIGVGIIGAAIIIVTLYTLRYIARKNAGEFRFPELDHPKPHTSCISSISSERTDQVVLLGGDEDDEF